MERRAMKTGLQALVSSVLGFALFGLLLFLPAGTFNYWQAWVFITVFVISAAVVIIYLGVKNPDVLRRRMRAGPLAETRLMQKIASSGFFVSFLAVLVVSGLDHRFGWSPVPWAVSVSGDVLVAIGLGIGSLVVVQNSYAAANIAVEATQKVVSTGLYGLVRHPMYLGSLIVMAGLPLALDSYWGLLVLVPWLLVIAIRILDEEKALEHELDGYRDYKQRVPSRLVPHVW
jgi:protein-S-isoprenylcysteine O-methyltransferase Ste14